MVVRACFIVQKPGIPKRYFDGKEAQRIADENGWSVEPSYVLELQTDRGVLHFELHQVPVVDA